MFSPPAELKAKALLWPIKLPLGISALLSLCLVGCGEPTEVLEPTFELTMGTGRDAFEPLPDGGELVLERGSQGLQHIYVSLRAPIAEGLHLIDVTITSNGRVFFLSNPNQRTFSFGRWPRIFRACWSVCRCAGAYRCTQCASDHPRAG